MDEPPKSNIRQLFHGAMVFTKVSPWNSGAPRPVCSFCRRGLTEVDCLVGSARAKICNECLRTFVALVDERRRAE
jgi:hypothetical protein